VLEIQALGILDLENPGGHTVDGRHDLLPFLLADEIAIDEVLDAHPDALLRARDGPHTDKPARPGGGVDLHLAERVAQLCVLDAFDEIRQ